MTLSVVTLSPDQNLSKAVDLMATREFRHLVITDENDKVLGIVSDRDILSMGGRISDWQFKHLSDVMTSNPISVKPETPLVVAVVR